MCSVYVLFAKLCGCRCRKEGRQLLRLNSCVPGWLGESGSRGRQDVKLIVMGLEILSAKNN